jgi:hypothetical protein
MGDWKPCATALSILVLAGCATPPADDAELDRQAVAMEIAAFTDAFWDAWGDGLSGVDRAMALFDDHPDFAYAAQGRVWRSLADLTGTFRSAFQVVQSQAVEIEETSIAVLGPDVAHLMQRGAYTITDTDGVVSERRPFAFSGLLVRTGSGWRVRRAHLSEVVRAGEDRT